MLMAKDGYSESQAVYDVRSHLAVGRLFRDEARGSLAKLGRLANRWKLINDTLLLLHIDMNRAESSCLCSDCPGAHKED